MQGNVKAIHPQAPTFDEEAVQAFDNAYADYLAAKAESGRWSDHEPDTAEAANALAKERFGRVHELLWKLIATPAELPRQIDDKFRVLLEELRDGEANRVVRAMLDSIRSDVLDMK